MENWKCLSYVFSVCVLTVFSRFCLSSSFCIRTAFSSRSFRSSWVREKPSAFLSLSSREVCNARTRPTRSYKRGTKHPNGIQNKERHTQSMLLKHKKRALDDHKGPEHSWFRHPREKIYLSWAERLGNNAKKESSRYKYLPSYWHAPDA